MNTGRRVFALLVVAVVLALPLHANAQRTQAVTVYKSPTCGCCGEWVKHLKSNGFKVEAHDVADLDPIKQKLGVRPELASCHTATVGGYTIEGHVPASDIRRLLAERPKDAKGLAVPGMPVGSPGMETGPAQPYATLLFDKAGGTRVFARH
ncbi:MAG TPA: DUF411 domain-containing protein [Burkholderiales bacterium]